MYDIDKVLSCISLRWSATYEVHLIRIIREKLKNKSTMKMEE